MSANAVVTRLCGHSKGHSKNIIAAMLFNVRKNPRKKIKNYIAKHNGTSYNHNNVVSASGDSLPF